LPAAFVGDVKSRFDGLELGRFIGEMVHGLMSALIGDVLNETAARLRAARPGAPTPCAVMAARWGILGDDGEGRRSPEGLPELEDVSPSRVADTMERARRSSRNSAPHSPVTPGACRRIGRSAAAAK